MNGTRVASTVGAAAVAAVAAYSSWQHMVATALRVGERPDVALLLPLSVDGLLVTASVALVDDRRAGRKPRMSARVAFAVGVAASLAANIAHAQPTWGARAVSAWPALALLLTVELLTRRGRAVEPATSDPVPDATQVSEPEAAPVRRRTSGSKPAAAKRSFADTRRAAAALAADGATVEDVARILNVTDRQARRALQPVPIQG